MKAIRLTKKLALKICIELWEWLAKTGNCVKRNWPGWKKYGKMDNDCPCCEYINQTSHTRECPIWKCLGAQSCFSFESPYVKWYYSATILNRKRYAQQVVNLAKKKLSELRA